MYGLNLHWNQVATLELWAINYTLLGRNPDGVTFAVRFDTEDDYIQALDRLLRS